MKLFRNIRQNLIEKGNLKKYIPYAIGEILLVMIGILLAFQVSKWNDNRIKRNNESKIYQNIKDHIIDDRNLINGVIRFNDSFMSQFKYANKIIEMNDRTKMDTLGVIIRNLTQYSDFNKQSNVYENMANSGEINLLNNHEIIELVRILDESYTYFNRMERIHYDAVIKYVAPTITEVIKLHTCEIMKPEEIYSFKFQNLILTLMQIMGEKTDSYTRAINHIDRTIELIDKELILKKV